MAVAKIWRFAHKSVARRIYGTFAQRANVYICDPAQSETVWRIKHHGQSLRGTKGSERNEAYLGINKVNDNCLPNFLSARAGEKQRETANAAKRMGQHGESIPLLPNHQSITHLC